MEDSVCIYNMFGFCKFKNIFRKQHLISTSGKSPKDCRKRYPKDCKNTSTEKGCRFGSESCHNHQINSNQEDENQKKFNLLINIVTKLFQKVISMDAEVKELKSGQNNNPKETPVLDVIVIPNYQHKPTVKNVQKKVQPVLKRIKIPRYFKTLRLKMSF